MGKWIQTVKRFPLLFLALLFLTTFVTSSMTAIDFVLNRNMGLTSAPEKNQPILRFDVRHVRDETGVCVNERLVSESKLES